MVQGGGFMFLSLVAQIWFSNPHGGDPYDSEGISDGPSSHARERIFVVGPVRVYHAQFVAGPLHDLRRAPLLISCVDAIRCACKHFNEDPKLDHLV